MTLRQKRLAKLVETSRTEGEAMLKAGYSPNTAIKPSQVKKSKGWQKLLDEKLPDEELLTATKEALYADKLVALPDEPNVVMPDHAVRLKAAEQGYKLKGKFTEPKGPDIKIVVPILGGKTKETVIEGEIIQ